MSTQVFITKQQVQTACKEIAISDWSENTDGKVDAREADIIRDIVGTEALKISSQDFKLALEVELEHGARYPDSNVSNNHPITTGRIVLAHLKESLDDYHRLSCIGLEMELTAALAHGNLERAINIRKELSNARLTFEASIAAQFL